MLTLKKAQAGKLTNPKLVARGWAQCKKKLRKAEAYIASLSSRFEKLTLNEGRLILVQATYSGSIYVLNSQTASPGVNKNGWCCSISFIELFT